MKRLQFESLETRRALSTTPLDILPGPAGSSTTVLGTLGKTIVANAYTSECTANRCLVAIDAIDHSVTTLRTWQALGIKGLVDSTGLLVIGSGQSGATITDGTPEGTRSVGSQTELFESNGRVYWGTTVSVGDNLQAILWNTDGEVSRSVEIPWYATEDGSDSVTLIGVVDDQPYFQVSDIRKGFGEMRVYRGTELLFSQDMFDMAFAPLYKAKDVGGSPVFEWETPSRHGLTGADGEVWVWRSLGTYYSDDGNVVWFFGDGRVGQYKATTGLVDLSPFTNPAGVVDNYNQQHPAVDRDDPHNLDLPNMITFNECGYAVLSSNSPETGQELAIWTPIVGDSTFDNVFDSSDLVAAFQSGLYESGVDAVWGNGDWNFDGKFDSSDLIAAFQAGIYRY